VTSEVVNSANPAFSGLQPRVPPRNTDAWQQAFNLAFQYLSEHQLTLTLRTYTTEKGDDPKVERQPSTANETLSGLIDGPLPSRLRAKQQPINLPEIPVKQGSPSPRLIEFDAIGGKSAQKKSPAPQKRPTGSSNSTKRQKSVVESRGLEEFFTDSDQ
jgi:hypothetical protein